MTQPQLAHVRWRSSPLRLLAALALLLGAPRASATPSFERVLDAPCRALALDREPYWAALGDEVVTVSDKRGVHQEQLPPALRAAADQLGVFFGRDYRVRIAGTAHTPQGDEVRYYRSLPGGLKPAFDELGPLGKAGAPGLVALLGTADPEIVCRPGMSCLIKRVSGWAKASAPAGLERVGLSLGNGWALSGKLLLRLERDWTPVGRPGSWQHADDAMVRGEQACVVERSPSRLHHWDGQSWQVSPSPVSGPRSLWASEEALWIAGDGGAARLEDGIFAAVKVPAGVAQVLGRSASDVWLCGKSGVYRSKP
ncbi:MAG TPA: hypothetical protein VIW29_23035 [Polyangiaceae bacterium]